MYRRPHFSETEVAQHAGTRFVIEEEVGGLDIAVDDTALVNVFKGLQ
jgi:hypothetical protein